MTRSAAIAAAYMLAVSQHRGPCDLLSVLRRDSTII